MANLFKEKIKQAYNILKEKDIDMWLTFVKESSITHDPVMDMFLPDNVTWQSAFILCKDGTSCQIVGSIEEKKFAAFELFDETIGYVQSVKEPLQNYIKKKNPSRIAINYSVNNTLADGLTHGMYITLKQYLDDMNFTGTLISSEEIISALKGRKSAAEIELMTKAVEETLKIYDKVTAFIRPGLTELDIAAYIKGIVKENGWGLAWEEEHCPAVFTGPDAQGAHSDPTHKKVEKGHVINIDFGINYNGYCSDIQRTWYVLKDGETTAPPEVQKGFDVIVESIQRSADFIRPGVLGCEVDDVARNYIVENGYEEYPHGLGHQVGTQAHDGGGGLFPRWERYGNLPFIPLEENQVYTIEPRLPIENYGVATIEEEVLVTSDGCRFISTPQKELIYIRS
jgi:Xaa-Pro aminopeptidase